MLRASTRGSHQEKESSPMIAIPNARDESQRGIVEQEKERECQRYKR